MTRDQFSTLPFEQQQAAINAATQSAQERQALLDQVKYYAENKQQQQFSQTQEQNRLARENIQTNINQTQSSQRTQEAAQNVQSLKQNTAFLGSWGRPVKSAAALDAMWQQIVRAETTFNLLKNVEDQYTELGKLGVEFNAKQFEESMRRLEKDLKDNVDSTVLAALNWFNAEAALASVDSPKKLFELQQKYLNQIDTSIEWLTNRQVRQLEQLQTTYNDIAKKRLEELKYEREQAQNEYVVNKDMSKALWYYVNNNWKPILNAQWATIPAPKEAPREPIFDAQTGTLVTFEYDQDWNIKTNVEQITQGRPETPNIQKVWVDDNGNDIYGYYDAQLGRVVTVNPLLQWNTTGLWDLRHLASQFPWQARAKNNNPAWITRNANFDNPQPWTTAYALQQAGIQYQKGTARPSGEGGNYVTFNTIDDWLAAQRIMMTQTYWNSTVNQMLQSRVGTWEWPRYAKQVAGNAWVDLNARVSDLSEDQLQSLQYAKIQKESPWLAKILSQQQQITTQTEAVKVVNQALADIWLKLSANDLQWLGDFLKKTQARGAWFSDKDVQAFNKSIDQAVSSWDQETVLQLYRDRLLADKNLSEVFYPNVQMIGWIQQVKELLSSLKAWGTDTWLMTNIVEDMANALGRTTDEVLAQANNALWLLVADYIRAISGTAASDREVERLVKNLPKAKNVDSFNQAIIQQIENRAKSNIKTTANAKMWFNAKYADKVFPEIGTTQPSAQQVDSVDQYLQSILSQW